MSDGMITRVMLSSGDAPLVEEMTVEQAREAVLILGRELTEARRFSRSTIDGYQTLLQARRRPLGWFGG